MYASTDLYTRAYLSKNFLYCIFGCGEQKTFLFACTPLSRCFHRDRMDDWSDWWIDENKKNKRKLYLLGYRCVRILISFLFYFRCHLYPFSLGPEEEDFTVGPDITRVFIHLGGAPHTDPSVCLSNTSKVNTTSTCMLFFLLGVHCLLSRCCDFNCT